MELFCVPGVSSLEVYFLFFVVCAGVVCQIHILIMIVMKGERERLMFI